MPAVILGVAGSFLFVRALFPPTGAPATFALARAIGNRRLIEPRLTGGFLAGPLRAASRDGADASVRDANTTPERQPPESWEVWAAAAAIKEAAGARPTEENRRALSSALLLLGDRDRAIEGFAELAEAHLTPENLSNLGAAYLARGLEADRGEDLANALDLSARALAIDDRHGEARFNQALALDSLGLGERARERWREIAADPSYPADWAAIARRHGEEPRESRALLQPAINTRVTSAAERGDLTDLRRLLAESVDGVAVAFETELLSGSLTPQGPAETVAREYFEVSGDDGFLKALTHAHSSADAREGLKLYALGRRQYERSEWARMEETFQQSRELLSRARSPHVSAVDLQLAIAALQGGRTREAHSRIGRALNDPQSSRRTRARALLVAGILEDSGGNWTAASARRRAAREAFKNLGDDSSAAYLDQQEASMLSRLGRTHDSWRSRLAALRQIDRFPDISRQVLVLNVVGNDCRRAGWPHAAVEFHREALARAGQSTLPEDRAETHLDLATALNPFDPVLAEEHAISARRELEQIDDPMMRQIMEGQSRRLLAERDIGTTGERIEAADQGIAWADQRGIPAIAAPLLLRRAQLRAQEGSLDSAEADNREVLRRLAVSRTEALSGSALLHLARAYENLIDLALRREENPRALADLVSARLDAEYGRRPGPLAEERWAETVNGPGLVIAFLPLDDAVLRFAAGLSQFRVDRIPIRRERLDVLVRRSVARLRNDASEQDAAALMATLFRGLEGLTRSAVRTSVASAGSLAGFPYSFIGSRAAGAAGDQSALEVVTGLHAVDTGRPRSTRRPALVVAFSAQAMGLPPLPGALKEAARIAGLYGSDARLLTGDQATVKAMENGLTTASVLHIATHTVSEAGSAAGASILLSDRGADLFTALRISNMRLEHLNLAVLAACDTARPADPTRGTPLSLASAFIEAGVGQVLASYWALSDGATVGIMDDFHRRITQGESPEWAIREIQRTASGQERIRDAAALTLIAGKPQS